MINWKEITKETREHRFRTCNIIGISGSFPVTWVCQEQFHKNSAGFSFLFFLDNGTHLNMAETASCVPLHVTFWWWGGFTRKKAGNLVI